MSYIRGFMVYRQTCNIRRTVVGNRVIDHCRHCSNYIFILGLTPDFNGLGKDNRKMRRKTFKYCDLVWLILEVWWYSLLFSLLSSSFIVSSQEPRSFNNAAIISSRDLLAHSSCSRNCSISSVALSAIVKILLWSSCHSNLDSGEISSTRYIKTNRIWVRSQNCGCLVTWFCYQLIAKPGNKTATVPWPDPYILKRSP